MYNVARPRFIRRTRLSHRSRKSLLKQAIASLTFWFIFLWCLPTKALTLASPISYLAWSVCNSFITFVALFSSFPLTILSEVVIPSTFFRKRFVFYSYLQMSLTFSSSISCLDFSMFSCDVYSSNSRESYSLCFSCSNLSSNRIWSLKIALQYRVLKSEIQEFLILISVC